MSISHFSNCTDGAKDPPKAEAPIVRCCLNVLIGLTQQFVEWNDVMASEEGSRSVRGALGAVSTSATNEEIHKIINWPLFCQAAEKNR